MTRLSPAHIDAATFRDLGHRLVDQVAGLLESLPAGPVTRDESPTMVREALGLDSRLPQSGTDPAALLQQTAPLLFAQSLTTHGDTPNASKSIFSRTAQSGQHQSSGTSDQGVPGGKPSRGAPARSS